MTRPNLVIFWTGEVEEMETSCCAPDRSTCGESTGVSVSGFSAGT